MGNIKVLDSIKALFESNESIKEDKVIKIKNPKKQREIIIKDKDNDDLGHPIQKGLSGRAGKLRMESKEVDESSSAFKKSVKLGGQDTQDYLDGKAIAKVKDKDERDRLVATKRLEKSGKLGNRPTVAQELKRKEDQIVPNYEKKATKYAMKKDIKEGFNEDDYDVVKEFGHASVCVNKNDKNDVRIHLGGSWYVKPEIAEITAGYYEKKGVKEGDLYYKDYKETKDAIEYAKQLQSKKDITEDKDNRKQQLVNYLSKFLNKEISVDSVEETSDGMCYSEEGTEYFLNNEPKGLMVVASATSDYPQGWYLIKNIKDATNFKKGLLDTFTESKKPVNEDLVLDDEQPTKEVKDVDKTLEKAVKDELRGYVVGYDYEDEDDCRELYSIITEEDFKDPIIDDALWNLGYTADEEEEWEEKSKEANEILERELEKILEEIGSKRIESEKKLQKKFGRKFMSGFFGESKEEDEDIIYSINEYTPDPSVIDFYNEIVDEDKIYDLGFIVEDIYPEGVTTSQLNDLLANEEGWVRDMLDMNKNESEDDTDIIPDSFVEY